jgi:Fe-S-cluster containining protein
MDEKEFTEKVKNISDKRGSVWVALDMKFGPESKESLEMILNSFVECKRCGKCCNGFWFNIVPLYKEDKDKMISMGISSEDFDKFTKPASFNGESYTALVQPCKFFTDCGCSIYEKRPVACNKFPVQVMETIKINVCCPAGLELYLKLAKRNHFTLDSEGI